MLGGSAEAFTAENECISTFGLIFCVFYGRRVVLDATLSSLLACSTKCVCVSGCSPAQVLIGDVEDAICLHAFYYAIWKRYGALPERYNWQLQAPDVPFYPLRPELVESTYLLYQVWTSLSCTAGLGQNASVQKVPFPPRRSLFLQKIPFPPDL